MPEPVSPTCVGTRIVALSAECWALEPDRCRQVVHESLENGSTRFLLLDAFGLKRVRTADDLRAPESGAGMHVHLGDWLRVTAQHYSADEERIARDVVRAAGRTLWIDGAAHDSDALKDVLRHMRRILFGAGQWPETMVFILRDDFVQAAMDMLPGTFYMLPSTKSQRESSLYAFNIYRIARRARMFGLSPRSIRSRLSGEGIAHRWRKLMRQDELDYIK